MSLNKVNYVDGVTVITAENMNDIQDAIISLQETPEQGLTDAMKQALLQLAQKVAYIDDQGQTYYQDLYDAFYPPADLVSITAVYTQSGTVYPTTPLDDLKADLVVTANYSDGNSPTVTSYSLYGTLSVGTSIVSVEYAGKTATFSVEVTTALDSIAYGSLTYRDIFISNNEVVIGNFEDTLSLSSTAVDIGNGRSYKINAGSPAQTTEAYDSPSHSLKCFGTSSTQILYQNSSKSFAAQKYLVCASVNVTRYSAGYAGGQFNWPDALPTAQRVDINISAVTSGFTHVAKIITLSAARTGCRFYIGSYSNANLDCYIDDVVCTPVPSDMTEAQGLALYDQYLHILREGL